MDVWEAVNADSSSCSRKIALASAVSTNEQRKNPIVPLHRHQSQFTIRTHKYRHKTTRIQGEGGLIRR